MRLGPILCGSTLSALVIGLAVPAAASGTVPGAPRSVTATPGNTQITVAWKAPSSSGSSAITGYTATCTPTSGSAGSKTVSGSTLTATVTGLINGTGYTCTVKATNSAGTGAASTPTASVTPTAAPSAPRNPTQTTATGKVTVKWAAPTSSGASAITGYPVACTSNDGGATLSGTAAASATSLALTGLPNNKTYRCTVKATNASGTSLAATAAGYVEHAATTSTTHTAVLHLPVTAGQEVSATADSVTFTNNTDSFTSSANGTQLYDQNLVNGDTHIVFQEKVSTTSGTATLTVTSPSGVTGAAELSGYAFADVKGTITANGAVTKVSVAYPSQESYSTFSGTAGQKVSLVVGTNTIDGGGGYIHLLNPSGNEINFSGVFPDAYIDATSLATTGTYTISIDHGYTGPGTANLQLYTVPNNTGTITLNGSTVAVSLPTPGENATRTFHGTAGQVVTVTYTNDTIASGEVDLLDPSNNEIGYVQLYGDPSTAYSISNVTLPTTGTYTILVDPAGSHTGNVTLKLHT